MVVIREGMPFVVPPGKILVLTALGATSPDSATVTIDQTTEAIARGHTELGNATSMKLLPPGLTAREGQTVAVGNSVFARAWGYLVDA